MKVCLSWGLRKKFRWSSNRGRAAGTNRSKRSAERRLLRLASHAAAGNGDLFTGWVDGGMMVGITITIRHGGYITLRHDVYNHPAMVVFTISCGDSCWHSADCSFKIETWDWRRWNLDFDSSNMRISEADGEETIFFISDCIPHEDRMHWTDSLQF